MCKKIPLSIGLNKVLCIDETFYLHTNPITGTLANSKDPDEILHITAFLYFHQGLHSMIR